jgi:hypothetical protein
LPPFVRIVPYQVQSKCLRATRSAHLDDKGVDDKRALGSTISNMRENSFINAINSAMHCANADGRAIRLDFRERRMLI